MDDELDRLRRQMELISESLDHTQSSVELTIKGMIAGFEQLSRVEKNTQILIDQDKATFAEIARMRQRLDELERQQ